MTIEEWLDKRIKDAREDCLNQDIETYEDGYAEGYKDALQLVRDKLPFLDHEVTLREMKEFCQKQGEDCDDNEDSCDYCPMAEKYSDSDGITFMSCGKVADVVPHDWNIDDIQKRMKEARDD